jgi:hypothetical protein
MEMFSMNKLTHFLFTAVWITLSAASFAAMPPQGATLAPMAKAPVIDGKLADDEWRGAAGVVGFQEIGHHQKLDPRQGRTLFGFTREALYIMVETELPPDDQLIVQHRGRDYHSIGGDCIEIWIDPNRDTRKSGEGDRSFIHFIGNSIGAISDMRYDPAKGAPALGWNGKWSYENTVDPERGTWVAELSIPWTELGVKPESVMGRSIGILAARNWKRPTWPQTSAFPFNGSFDDVIFYPVFTLTENSPVVAEQSLGNLGDGRVDLQLSIYNPGPARTVTARAHIESSDTPARIDEKQLKLAANDTTIYSYVIAGKGTLNETAQHAMTVSVAPVEDAAGTAFFRHVVKWTKMREQKWQVRTRDQVDRDAAVRIAYYPSYNRLRVKVNTGYLEEETDTIQTGTVTVTNADSKQDVLNKPFTWEGSAGTEHFTLPSLPDGTYSVTVTLDGYEHRFVRTFKRTHFPFEGNALGITNQVYPPFEPVAVDNQTVSVVLRRYTTDGLGLWHSIQTRGQDDDTEYRELLASPMRLVANNQHLEGTGTFTSVADHEAVYQGQANHPAVTVETRTTTEYDGCMKVELTLKPGSAEAETETGTLNSLYLDIPLKDSEAPLFHASICKPRTNPAGTAPAGDGRVWDSRSLPDSNWYGNFIPYIWLGAEARGLAWFADNERGWELNVDAKDPAESTPCIELIRNDDVLTLRVNFIQKPVTVTEPRRIVFGLQASPTKPMRPDWRRVLNNRGAPGYLKLQWMGAQYWGSDSDYYNKYPRNGDMSILTAMYDARRGKHVNADAFNRDYVSRNLLPVPEADRDIYTHLNKVSIHRSALKPALFTVYWEVFWGTTAAHPEARIFQSEWSGGDWRTFPDLLYKQKIEANVGSGTLVDSYQDFACYYGAQFVHRGIGLYFDNCYPTIGTDPLTTNAYYDDAGRLVPSATMWRRRAYFKRIWILHQQLAPKGLTPVVMHHMTNTHILPFQTWSDCTLDLEWFYGPEPQQSKYPVDMLRTQSTGLQSGNMPHVLARVNRTSSEEEKIKAERTRFGVCMTHELKAYMPGADGNLLSKVLSFGYGLEGSRTYNYWDSGYPVATSNDDQVKSILITRNNEALLVLCSWNPNPETVGITVDAEAAGISAASAVDAETGDALPITNGKLDLELKGYAVRLLRLR